MNTYKFRTECSDDIGKFIRNFRFTIQSMTCEKHNIFPDYTVVISTAAELNDILDNVLDIGDDLHVLFESIQPIEQYTGERIRSFYQSTKDTHIPKK